MLKKFHSQEALCFSTFILMVYRPMLRQKTLTSHFVFNYSPKCCTIFSNSLKRASRSKMSKQTDFSTKLWRSKRIYKINISVIFTALLLFWRFIEHSSTKVSEIAISIIHTILLGHVQAPEGHSNEYRQNQLSVYIELFQGYPLSRTRRKYFSHSVSIFEAIDHACRDEDEKCP